MPSWVGDESTWDRAKDAFEESYGHAPRDGVDKDWAIVTTIYKNMGGRISDIIPTLSREAMSTDNPYLLSLVLDAVTDRD